MYNIILCNPTVGNALQKIFDCNTPCAAHKKGAGLLTYSFMVRMFIRDLINTSEAYNHIQFQTHIFKKSSFAVQCTCKGGFYYES